LDFYFGAEILQQFFDELYKKKHRCISCSISKDPPSYLKWCGKRQQPSSVNGNYNDCIFKDLGKDYEKELIEKITNGDKSLSCMGFGDISWCHMTSPNGSDIEKFYHKFKQVLIEHDHICYSMSKGCDCLCNNVKINWCNNYDKCLLNESIKTREKNNNELLEKLKNSNHKCIKIINATPQMIWWCEKEICDIL
jgi:hypothetical protein